MQPSIHWIINSFIDESSFGRIACGYTKAVDNCLYIHGGAFLTKRGRKLKVIDDMWKIQVENIADVSITLISQHGTKPEPRYRHHLCIVHGKLFLFGGKANVEDDVCLKGLYKYSPRSCKWREVSFTGTEPDSIGNSSACISDLVFTFGGTSRGKANNDMHCYDRSAKSWQFITSSGKIPTPRCDHAVTVIESDMYLFGGSGGPNEFYSDLYNFNSDTLQWTRVDTIGRMPIPRAGHSLIAHHKKDLYVVGGYNDQMFPDGGPILDGMEKYSFSHNRWKKPLELNNAPEPTYHHASWIIHNHLYILGGACLDGGVTTVRVAKILNPSQREDYVREVQLSEGDEFDMSYQYSQSSLPIMNQTNRSANPR